MLFVSSSTLASSTSRFACSRSYWYFGPSATTRNGLSNFILNTLFLILNFDNWIKIPGIVNPSLNPFVTGPLNGLLSSPIFNMGLLVPSPLLPFGRRAGVGKREVVEGRSCFIF